MVGSVGVAIFAKRNILVSMHGFDLPMAAVQAQNVLRIGSRQAGDEIGCLCFGFAETGDAE